jgi:phage terminase large subunit-like protein
MPWQQYVADVILEVDPATGLLVYREYVVTVPRQSGKTTLILAKMIHRALAFGGRQNILYTAQTRGAARKKWEDEHVTQLEASKYRQMFRVRRQLGQEAIRWKNGSIHGITSNTEKAGHGETLDEGVIDEAFAQEDSRLEQAFKPAMITRPQPQLGIISTAGTLKSVFLRGKVDAGRAGCEAGLTRGVAYIEWSAPDDADPADPATWWACMPALGHTVTQAAVQADYDSMKLSEFRRAYLNQWPDAAPDQWLVIPHETWLALEGTSTITGPVVAALDTTPERSFTSIAIAGRTSTDRLQVEIVDHRPGTAWVAERAKDMRDRSGITTWVIDSTGPAGSLVASLTALGLEVVEPLARQIGHATQGFYDGCCDSGEITHLGDPLLAAALAGAVKRPVGDGGWAWARKSTSVDVSPLFAASLAAWGRTTLNLSHTEEIEGSLMA